MKIKQKYAEHPDRMHDMQRTQVLTALMRMDIRDMSDIAAKRKHERRKH